MSETRDGDGNGSACQDLCERSCDELPTTRSKVTGEGTPPVAFRWESMFAPDGYLARCLVSSEAACCRTVCQTWRSMAVAADSISPQELWKQDVGKVRRATAWKQFLLGGIVLRQHAGTPQDSYEKLCETPSSYDSMIRRDVNRTLPQEELFREKNGKGQVALFRLLRALAIRLEDVGYCQSLNFIVATLIGVFPNDEVTAFQCALALLLRHSLVDLYRPKFPKLGVVVWQFDRIVEGFLPKVHAALVRHGVNSEYYAIQWFLTLFASDLQQPVVHRIWDRFLVAGWRVLVQVGLALLYTIQDTLPTLDTCHALSFLRRFARADERRQPEELLRAAASFKVSHRMLSALEAAYGWEEDVQLLVVKDLDDGQVHWAVQALPPKGAVASTEEEDEEGMLAMPRAFARGSEASGPDEASRPQGTVQPFLLRNLDTGETSVMETAWSQYTCDMDKRARAQSGPLSVRPTPGAEALASSGAAQGPAQGPAQASGLAAPEAKPEQQRGSSWMHNVQQQAVRRLGQT